MIQIHQNKIHSIVNSIIGIIFAFILFSFINFNEASAQDYDSQISQKKTEIANIGNQISQLKSDLSSSTNDKNASLLQLEDISNRLVSLNNSVEDTKVTIRDLITEIANKIQLIKENENNKDKIISQTFKTSKSDSNDSRLAVNSLFMKDSNEIQSIFGSKIHEKKVQIIEALNLDKTELEKDKESFEKSLSDFTLQINDLNSNKIALENRISELSRLADIRNTQISDMQSQLGQIQTEIVGLQEEQRLAIERDNQIQRESQVITVSNDDIKSGEIYFSGRGRDLYDGHAVGMSQWGIYGAGLAGMDYITILKKYYTGVQVGGDYSSEMINVSGYGKMDIETYVSGLGEIPSYACENDGNKDKEYVVKDNPNSVFDCWPEEAIKAQVVAARSYALAQISSDPNKVVATDASFQVYLGGVGKEWAANATKGQVVSYNGRIATTVYSSSMRGATEDNELLFTRKSVSTVSKQDLIGTPYPYLRGVDESSWAYQNNTYNWQWKTKSYSLDKLSSIFKDTYLDVGNLVSISSETGKSPRVWVIILVGDKGMKYITGWKFKDVMNDWIYENEPADNRALLYSTEFSINK